jgi:protein TonB
VQQLEQETKRLLTQLKSNYSVAQEKTEKKPVANDVSGEELVQRALEIARLEAEISKSLESYEKLPKRKFIGARTQEYRYAQYVEDWRGKVERIGNMNYPQQARDQKIYGKLTLTVSIRADGSLESVEINRSSGQRILDAAAMRIVKLAAPYAVFPPDIRKETDVLSITRTWTFTSNDQLQSE